MKRFLTMLFFLLLTGCAVPAQEPITPTTLYKQCAYVEGRKTPPKLSDMFIEKLKAAALPIETARAEAYGENCIAADGMVVSFSQREVDFYATLNVTDLKDEASLGNQLEQILMIIDQLPPDETGPNPGYVGVTFQSDGHIQNLWFTLFEANALRKQETKGADLYKALLKTP